MRSDLRARFPGQADRPALWSRIRPRIRVASIVRMQANFDFRPGVIARDLNLFAPVYEQTACYGHFGRAEFTWEQPKSLDLDPAHWKWP